MNLPSLVFALARSALRAGAALVVAHSAAAAPDYPARPIEIVVPWAVGGGSDAVARAFAEAAAKHVTQPIVVINRPGAAGSIGHQDGALAKPDGYKLTLVTPEVSLAFLQGIGKTRWQDFSYIARINADPIALVVRADAPWTTLEQFLDHARANAGKVAVSNSGAGATYHLAAIAVENRTGVQFNDIPYVGAGPAVIGLLGGQVDATFATAGEVGTHVKAGKLRLLAVMAADRLKDFDQVPTFRERGIDLQLGTWRALAAPKGTPADVIAALRRLVDQVVQEPGYRAYFARQYLGLVNDDGASFRAALEREYAFYADAVGKLALAAK
jgi:tripartite-type tricarboxylate transporter receptor subunit TctC